MSSLISREAVIQAINKYCDGCIYRLKGCWQCPVKGITTEINAAWTMPEEPAERWIPVSARLPEEAKEVLVTVRDLAESTTFVELAYLCHLGIFIATEDMTYLWSEDGYEVLAWQPLSEPYKGGEE